MCHNVSFRCDWCLYVFDCICLVVMTRWLSCFGGGGPSLEGLATSGCCTECGCSASVVGFVVLWLVVACCAIIMFAFMIVASLCMCVYV